jgi:hypothetical protein
MIHILARVLISAHLLPGSKGKEKDWFVDWKSWEESFTIITGSLKPRFLVMDRIFTAPYRVFHPLAVLMLGA